jgi:ribosome-binding protein aMBF1 (putative translation factor)
MRLASAILDGMPICKACEDEVDELVAVKVDGRKKKVCEDCAERLQEEAAIAEESESVVQNMMGFKGRR